MSETASQLMHYSNVLVSERVAIAFLLVALVGMFLYRENRRSSRWLLATFLMETLQIFADSETFAYSLHQNLPVQLAVVFYFMAYTFGSLTMIAFTFYVKSYIEEKTVLNPWIFRLPVIIEGLNFIILSISIFSRTVYRIADGRVTAVGSVPVITNILLFVVIFYIPLASLTKIRIIGGKAVLLLGAFGLAPAVVLFISYDYSLITAAAALLIVYVLLQSDRSEERERKRQELSDLNEKLRQANEEQLSQMEEITALNDQLQENQTKLEESSAEQEAQLEEITALNDQFERNQADLEDSLAEQEVQLKEIQRMNRDAQRRISIIQSAIKVYFASYYIDLEEDSYIELSSIQNIRQHGFTSSGKAQESLDRMCELLIRPDFKTEMKTFVNLSSLNERLRNKDSDSIQYIGNTTGWSQAFFIAGNRKEDGTLKTVIWGARTIHKEKEKELAQLRIVEEEQEKISEAYGMIEGFSREYHTIWLVDKETLQMRLIRSNGISTVKSAVEMGQKMVGLDPTVRAYVAAFVEPEDRERAERDMSSGEVLRHLKEYPNDIYAVNYLRRDENGHIGYHQIAFANADTAEGKKQFVLGFRDIDQIVKEEQKQKEELKEARDAAEAANRAKTAFLFNMSHDIRTPMNAIIGFTDLIEKHYDEKEKCMDYLRKTKQANQFLLSLINDILEMARIESGKASLDVSVSPVGGIAREAAGIFEEQMEKKGITFESCVETYTKWAFYDQTKIRKIYLNILSNALKYTPAGGTVSMRVNELPGEEPGSIIMKAVFSDTGIGMSKEFLPHLYESFTRERTSTESRQQGTGLGMPIVKSILDFIGGTIDVQSEPGKGTTFTVTYPLCTKGAEPPEPAENVQVQHVDFSGKRILLAEDNDLNAEIAEEILCEAGFEVERAVDGVVCVDLLRKAADHYYDLILMDIQMPNMNGYEAARTIRSLPDPLKNQIPILAMTANAFEEDMRHALEAGMNDHLSKPIDIAKLMETLQRVLISG